MFYFSRLYFTHFLVILRTFQGVTLRKDEEGGITATNTCDCDLLVKDYDKPMSVDVVKCRGNLPYNDSIKVSRIIVADHFIT